MVADEQSRRILYERLTQVLGEDEAMTMMTEFGATERLERRLASLEESTVAGFERVDVRFEQVDQRLAQIDERFEAIDERFNQIDQRFEAIDERFERLEGRVGALDDRLVGLEHQIDARFHEIVGVLRKDMLDFQRTLFFSMAAMILTLGILLFAVLRFV